MSIDIERVRATRTILETRDLPQYLRSVRSNPPSELHHFTSADGLLGILSSETLRLTRAVCSNDSTEVRHLVDSTRVGAEMILEMNPDNLGAAARASLEKLVQRLKDDHAGWSGDLRLSSIVVSDMSVPDPYVACFCGGDKPPGLLHWGHYGRAGEGFSIQIDTTQLPEEWRTRFVRVRYDSVDQVFDVMRVLETFLLKEVDHTSTDLADRIDAVIRALSVGMKDPAFEPEEEWRVTWLREVDGDLEVKIRSAGVELIAFVEMPLPLDAIRRIVVGTKRDMRRTAGSLAAFLHRRGAFHVEIDESSVPFR